jgi:hypothetical protein
MMNALKFLAVDRSLDSGKDRVGRFQMRELGMLPVLTEKRPAAVAAQPSAPAKPGTSRRSMWRRLVGWVGRSGSVDVDATGVPVEDQPELQPVCRAQPEAAAPTTESNAEAGGRFARFTGYNPFNRTEKKAVQAEFRFENVRVVCNELHDTDFIIKT